MIWFFTPSLLRAATQEPLSCSILSYCNDVIIASCDVMWYSQWQYNVIVAASVAIDDDTVINGLQTSPWQPSLAVDPNY